MAEKLPSGLFSWADLISARVKPICEGKPKHALSTGFKTLDLKLFGGFYDGTLNIISGRTSSGKTTFVTNIIGNMIRDPNIKGSVVFYSIEMTNEDIINKLCTCFSETPLYEIYTSKNACSHLTQEIKKITGASKLLLSDRSNITIEQIQSELISIKKRHDLSAVMIDGVSLIQTSEHFDSRSVELGYIASRLKGVAKDLQIPIIVTAPMNRQGEEEDEKADWDWNEFYTPKASYLRDSGALEQNADIVMILRHPTYYDGIHANAELHIVKNRFNYGAGVKPLYFSYIEVINSFYENGQFDIHQSPDNE